MKTSQLLMTGGILLILYSLLISVCIECIHFSPEKQRVELCISIWSGVQ